MFVYQFQPYCKCLPLSVYIKLRGLGIMVYLQGKPALSMEEGCKNHKCEMASDLTVSNVQK